MEDGDWMRKRRPILTGEIGFFFSLLLNKASLLETELSFVEVLELVVEILCRNECFAFSSLLWYCKFLAGCHWRHSPDFTSFF